MQARAENFPPYTTPEVRDLAWACFSPPLLEGARLAPDLPLRDCAFPLDRRRREWLAALDRAPGPLLAVLGEARQGRLGLYFEKLWHFFLREDPEAELVAHNLPVREGERTLGEFDCIYFCRRRQRHVHLELAVKFYLLRAGADAGQWRHWLGPDTRDRLDLKLARMLEHQVRLADTPAGRKALQGLGVGDTLREIAFKGRLFCHAGDEPRGPRSAAGGLTLHRWMRRREVERYLPDECACRLLERSDWLARVAAGGRTGSSGSVHGALPPAIQYPVQVAVLGPDSERERLFVTPDDWPA